MLFWFNLLCIAGLAISLLLTLRHKHLLSARIGHGLLQAAIWALVWTLGNPLALLPEGEPVTARLDTESAARELARFTPTSLQRLQSLELAGDGLSRNALRDMPPVRLNPDVPGESPAWSLQWQRNLNLGNTLALKIAHTGGGGLPSKVTLEDPFGNAVDSGILSTEAPAITLRDRPKLAGQWEYRVRVEPATPTAEPSASLARAEVLPVAVYKNRRPSVLLWLARPGFESAALSRWLRQSGSPTQVLTQLAPEMVRRQVFNDIEPVESGPLDSSSPFDLLILDSRLWPQLSASDRKQLQTIAREKSLLWLLHGDPGEDFLSYAAAQGVALRKSTAQDVAYPQPRPSDAPEPPTIRLAGYQPAATTLVDTELTAGEQIIYRANIQPRHSLGFIFFQNSYRWQTAGFDTAFSQLWADIFAKQLAWQGGTAPVAVREVLPLENQRLTLCSTGFTASSSPVVQAVATTDVSTNAALSPAWAGPGVEGNCYNYWPTQAGWHQVRDRDFAFYVFPRDSWGEWQTHLRRTHTAQMATARLGPRDASADASAGRPVPRHWLVLILLMLLGGTWLAERRTLR